MLPFLDPDHIHAFAMSLLRLGVWLLLLTIVFLPLERLFAVRPRKVIAKNLPGDLGFFLISGLVPSLLLTPPLALIGLAAHTLVPAAVPIAVAALPLWLRAVAALVISEIGFYWGHRLSHEIPFLWRFHAIHHAPEEIYFLVSAHAHPIDNVFVRLCGLVPVFVLGLATPLTPEGGVISALLVLAATLWGFLIHANVRWRLGPLEWLISTPAFHHWHHTKGEPRDRNYASMLPCMDWIFGTYHLPRKEWPQTYGTDTKVPTSLAGQLLYPLLATPSFSLGTQPSSARNPPPA